MLLGLLKELFLESWLLRGLWDRGSDYSSEDMMA